jgi:hypothetical protein
MGRTRHEVFRVREGRDHQIGGGVFGLDDRLLILQFLDAIDCLDERLESNEDFDIWLVIRDSAQFEAASSVFLELLLRARSEMFSPQIERCGVPILDRFAARMAHHSSEDWAKWQLCRFTEIALEIMCYSLSRWAAPKATPETLFAEGRPPTFGSVRELALQFAISQPAKMDVWGAKFFALVLKNKAAASALQAVNAQRNNLAHGRTSLPFVEIRKLVVQGLQLKTWAGIFEVDGELRLDDWSPWVAIPSANRIGLFERWQKNGICYLVPETGEVFKVPREIQVAASPAESRHPPDITS